MTTSPLAEMNRLVREAEQEISTLKRLIAKPSLTTRDRKTMDRLKCKGAEREKRIEALAAAHPSAPWAQHLKRA
jgi:hypothetical protein